MSFNDIGVSGVILAVVALFVGFGVVKGALKLFYGFLCLLLTAVASWAGHQFLYPRLEQTWPNIPEHGQTFTAIICGVLAFVILKGITDFFSDPFDDDEKKSSSFLGILMGFALGFVVCLFAVYSLLDQGSRAEMQYWVAQAERKASNELPRIAVFKDKVMKTKIGKQLAEYFSIQSSAKETLAELAKLQLKVSESTENSIQGSKYKKILTDARVAKLLQDPDAIAAIESGDYSNLYSNPHFAAILADPEMNRAISEIDIEQDLKLR